VISGRPKSSACAPIILSPSRPGFSLSSARKLILRSSDGLSATTGPEPIQSPSLPDPAPADRYAAHSSDSYGNLTATEAPAASPAVSK
jgi:hypothetical protein